MVPEPVADGALCAHNLLILTGYAFILRELATADPEKYRVLLKPMHPTEIVAAVNETLA